MLFGGFLLHKTNQKAFLWGSWYISCFCQEGLEREHLSWLGTSQVKSRTPTRRLPAENRLGFPSSLSRKPSSTAIWAGRVGRIRQPWTMLILLKGNNRQNMENTMATTTETHRNSTENLWKNLFNKRLDSVRPLPRRKDSWTSSRYSSRCHFCLALLGPAQLALQTSQAPSHGRNSKTHASKKDKISKLTGGLEDSSF